MKTYSIRLPSTVQEKLKTMDTDYIRKVLIEVAGMTYMEEKKLILIEDLVKKYITESIGNIKQDKNEVNQDMTDLAVDSILEIMN